MHALGSRRVRLSRPTIALAFFAFVGCTDVGRPPIQVHVPVDETKNIGESALDATIAPEGDAGERVAQDDASSGTAFDAGVSQDSGGSLDGGASQDGGVSQDGGSSSAGIPCTLG